MWLSTGPPTCRSLGFCFDKAIHFAFRFQTAQGLLRAGDGFLERPLKEDLLQDGFFTRPMLQRKSHHGKRGNAMQSLGSDGSANYRRPLTKSQAVLVLCEPLISGCTPFSTRTMMPQPSIDTLSHHASQGKTLAYALRFRTHLHKCGLEAHKSIGNSIVSMLVGVGEILDAEKVFDRLVSKMECSWNSLISAYIKLGEASHGIGLYQRMREDSMHPNEVTFVALLNACAKLKDVERGNELHAEIAAKGLLKSNKFVGNALVDMYAKCGLVAKAREVFDMLPARDVVTWTALVAGYAQHDHGEEALKCYQQMQLNGIHPNVVTYTCSLKACGSIAALDKGEEIHAQIEREGLLKTNSIVGNALVDMYAKCGFLKKAQEVFDRLLVRNVAAWNTVISGYVQEELAKEALNCYEQMQLEGVPADAVTFTCILKACGIVGAVTKGKEIHMDIKRKGLLHSQFIGNALVDMYAKCGVLTKAQEVFDELPVRHLVAWNALIVGYTEKNCGAEALECFKQMQLEGVSPDPITVVCVLKACGSIGALEQGSKIHDHFDQKGFFEKDPSHGSQLVDMYAKWGFLEKAQEEFDKLLVQDEVAWTALIAGYVQHDYGEEALVCFEQMQVEGVSPDAVTFACSLKACGSIGLADKGQEIHAEVARKGLAETGNHFASALVDMYAKCGMLTQAQEAFDSIVVYDVISWTALVTGYAQQGEIESVVCNFDRMRETINPNSITFISVLNACSHAGFVDMGQTFFEAMTKEYDIIPSFEHYTCIVDLFGRAGQLEKSVAIMKETPFYNNMIMWRTLLGACRKWHDVELAKQAYEQAVQLDEEEVASHISMYNIYADAGLLEDAEEMEV